jgi:hypothetical protein
MDFFSEIVDEDSMLHGYGHGKRTEDISDLLASSDFISDED